MQSVDSLERDVEHQKRSLKYNVEELQERARDAVDWRVQVQRHPLAMLGLAALGGLLVASAFRPAQAARATASLAAAALPLATKAVMSRGAFSRRKKVTGVRRVIHQARRSASRAANHVADRLRVGDWDGTVDRRAQQHPA
jgi:hypothetical protein